MVVVSILPHAEFGRIVHRGGATHFTFSADYGGMAKIKVNSTLLWKPDIVLHNSVTGNFKTTEQGHHYKSKSSEFTGQSQTGLTGHG